MKVWGIVGWKNSGKTTVVEKLVREFIRRGLTVSTIKHSHHAFEIDRPGTDSARHVAAGASEVLLGTSRRWALLQEHGPEPEGADSELAWLMSRLAPVDLVLIEGFKGAVLPKIEVVGPDAKNPAVADVASDVRGFACDGAPPKPLPAFPRDDIGAIADFIASELELSDCSTSS